MAGTPDRMEPRDRWAVKFIEAIPELAAAVGGVEEYLDELRALRSDEEIRWRDQRLHVEIYGSSGDVQVLFHHGFGAYSGLYGPFLLLLARQGVKVLALDRPGHGLSEGRRGDCTVAELADVSRVIAAKFVSPPTKAFVVFGSSAGGMLTSCLIPYLGDLADGFICHGVHNPAYRRRWLGSGVAWTADQIPMRFPYRLIPTSFRNGISEVQAIRTWFRPGSDELATFDQQTVRSVTSMTLSCSSPRPASASETPVLVLTGSSDTMLAPRKVIESVGRMRLPSVETELVEGGHMLLHERPGAVLDRILPWLSGLTTRSTSKTGSDV